MSEITVLLDAAAARDRRAAADLMPLVYAELRALAAARLAAEPAGNILQPTALVHEAYLRLVGPADAAKWDGRGHFFAAAAEAMRASWSRPPGGSGGTGTGAGSRRVDLDGREPVAAADPDTLLALDEALTALAAGDAPAADVARLHLFAGLPVEDAAAALGVSRATAYRQWTYARAYLRAALGEDDSTPS